MRAMVLLDEVVEICTLPQFVRIWHDPFRFQLFESLWTGRIFINRDDTRRVDMRYIHAFFTFTYVSSTRHELFVVLR